MTPAKLERRTFSTDAYDAIRQTLLESGQYVAGQKISVESIARDLGVSRSPVWAAIAKLEAEGLVQTVPRQGVFLTAFEPAKLTAIFEAREGLEGMAARLAARRATAEEIGVMRDSLTRQSAALKTADLAGYQISNLEFHHALLSSAKSASIEVAVRAIYTQTAAMCLGRKSPSGQNSLESLISEHRATFYAIVKRDEEAAETEARRHVRNLAQSFLETESA